MPEYTRRRLDQKPSKEELQATEQLLSAPQPNVSGFGVPKKFEPPKPPEKPIDLDTEVHEWLEGADPNAENRTVPKVVEEDNAGLIK